MTKGMTWYGRKGRTVRGESPVGRSRGEIWRQSRVQERGGGEGHPDRTTAAELVVERRWWGEEAGVSGRERRLAEPETGKARRLQGAGPVLLASTSCTPEVLSLS